jgi:hypothetical protein
LERVKGIEPSSSAWKTGDISVHSRSFHNKISQRSSSLAPG